MTDKLDFDTLFITEIPVSERLAPTLALTEALPDGSYPKYDMTGYDYEQLPAFQPAFTPAELLNLGVFGRNYFGGAHADFKRDFDGFDTETFEAAVANCADGHNSWKRNYYGVKAGMDYKWWLQQGMIFPEDPLGWFQWFCRFHAGRRHMRDAHQIARHQNFVRWAESLHDQFHRHKDMSPIICQSLLHWSWHPRDIIRETIPPISN